MMNKKNKPIKFLMYLGLFILFLTGHNFARYFVFKDYPLNVFTACDPNRYVCFEKVADDPSFSFYSGPYLKVEISAKYAPSCLDEHDCVNFTCEDIPGFCKITYCSEEDLEEGEMCSNVQ